MGFHTAIIHVCMGAKEDVRTRAASGDLGRTYLSAPGMPSTAAFLHRHLSDFDGLRLLATPAPLCLIPLHRPLRSRPFDQISVELHTDMRRNPTGLLHLHARSGTRRGCTADCWLCDPWPGRKTLNPCQSWVSGETPKEDSFCVLGDLTHWLLTLSALLSGMHKCISVGVGSACGMLLD